MKHSPASPRHGRALAVGAFTALATLALAGCDQGSATPTSSAASAPAAASVAGSSATASSAMPAGSAAGSEGLRAAAPKAYTAPEETKVGTLPAEVGLAVGSTAPDVEVQDSAGKAVKLSAFTADGNVLLVFYRGGW